MKHIRDAQAGLFFEVDILITKVAPVHISKSLIAETIEASLAHTAAEHARMAMEDYGKTQRDGSNPTPMQLFERHQDFSWSMIFERPLAALNALDHDKGEGFDFVHGSHTYMEKYRTVSEWEEILGVRLDVPTFSEAVVMWEAEREKEQERARATNEPTDRERQFGYEEAPKHIGPHTSLGRIVRLVREDFGRTIREYTAKRIRDAATNGSLIWTSEHLKTTDDSQIYISRDLCNTAEESR